MTGSTQTLDPGDRVYSSYHHRARHLGQPRPQCPSWPIRACPAAHRRSGWRAGGAASSRRVQPDRHVRLPDRRRQQGRAALSVARPGTGRIGGRDQGIERGRSHHHRKPPEGRSGKIGSAELSSPTALCERVDDILRAPGGDEDAFNRFAEAEQLGVYLRHGRIYPAPIGQTHTSRSANGGLSRLQHPAPRPPIRCGNSLTGPPDGGLRR